MQPSAPFISVRRLKHRPCTRGLRFKIVIRNSKSSRRRASFSRAVFYPSLFIIHFQFQLTTGHSTFRRRTKFHFFQIPNITVTGQNLASGDFFVITNKSKTGFDIVFKNSSNTIIDKTFDFQARGVGLKN